MERRGMASDLRRQELHVGPATLEIEVLQGCRGVASDLEEIPFCENPKMPGLDVTGMVVKVVMSGTPQQMATCQAPLNK